MQIALDESARRIDVDGRMHVNQTRISKAIVNQYLGREIPGWESLGLDADRIYSLLRDPTELEKAAPTFARLPILSTHEPITVQTHRPDLVVGAIGSEVVFDGEYLCADISIWDESAIAGVESKKISELSCAYRYTPVMIKGNFNGAPYDGIMTEIVGNHLALVEKGRAGPDVVVADSLPPCISNQYPNHTIETPSMKMTKLGNAIFVAMSAASPVLAADSALPALVGTATRKTINKPELIKQICALDAALPVEKVTALVNAIAFDEDPEDKEDDDKKPAEDEDDEDEKDDKEDTKAAMDSKINLLRQEFKFAAEAREDVRDTVGPVFGMGSAAEIYGFALDHLKVDHKGIKEVAALKALYKVASKKPEPTRIAQDAAPNTNPNVKRIRQL